MASPLPGHRLLWQLTRTQHPRLLLALLCATLAAPAALLPFALLAQIAVAHWQTTLNSILLYQYAGWLALALVLKYLLYSLAYYFSHVAAYQLLMTLRQQAVAVLTRLSLPQLQRYQSGELKQLVLQDIERLEQFIGHHSVEGLAALVSPLVALIALGWIDIWLALAALSPLPLALVCQAVVLRRLGPLMVEFNRSNSELNSTVVEYIRMLTVMRIFCQDSESFGRMRKALSSYQQQVSTIIRQTVPGWSLFIVLTSASVLVLTPVAIYRLQQGLLTPADAVLALMLSAGMLQPLLKVAKLTSELREILAASQRIYQLITAPLNDPMQTINSHVAPSITSKSLGSLHVNGLYFSYRQQSVLQPLSFQLDKGSFTALIGPSGAGKSTLAQLLCGLLEPDGGNIVLSGQSLAQLDDRQRCQRISLVSQQNQLFRGSIRNNLQLARDNASDHLLWQALQVAQAAQFVYSLPDGLDTQLDEQSSRLSGGERQRLCVARALLSPAPLLILDEATAFADSQTEQRFYQQVRQYWPERTLLVIAHRLQAVCMADQLLLLEQGSLVAQGNHDQLLFQSPLYQQLWQQANGVESY
jgi:sulfate-transporting ATPase/ATP-binding cassette subfamily B protein